MQGHSQEVGRGIEGNSSGCLCEASIGDDTPRGTCRDGGMDYASMLGAKKEERLDQAWHWLS